ncbi:hypothetical protein LQZ18_12145 [Lachnospiraceae bacterium ZAX-1]
MKREQEREEIPSRNNAYIEGNTVYRVEHAANERRQERQIEEEKPRIDHATRKNREKALQMNFGYVFFLTLASVATVFICTKYIQLQSQITGEMKNISSLESQVLDFKTENDAALKRVDTSVDLEQIKIAAVNDLSMVYPSKDQIHYFQVDPNDYMNQYEAIPEK